MLVGLYASRDVLAVAYLNLKYAVVTRYWLEVRCVFLNERKKEAIVLHIFKFQIRKRVFEIRQSLQTPCNRFPRLS